MLGRLRKNEVNASEVALYLAGQIGQASLHRLGRSAHPVLDQHIAAVSEAMIPIVGSGAVPPDAMLTALVRYAGGFIDAAISGGWRPAPFDRSLDAQSMRLAAVCRLVQNCGAEPADED
ncbi:MAG TPA: DUF6401 family natural product biosynthesis protein [Streptosporangiaceae bacterium]|nr:DUF6401 family natural product biosynthesis protein [Streptosporangiaceae bacterium]